MWKKLIIKNVIIKGILFTYKFKTTLSYFSWFHAYNLLCKESFLRTGSNRIGRDLAITSSRDSELGVYVGWGQ